MAKQATSAHSVLTEINQGKISPVYMLMGDESYYIDLVTKTLLDRLIKEDERDFDLNIVYGKDVTMNDVVVLSRQYPMLASKKVVVVKEAQDISKFDDLSQYIQNPMPSTVLIINYKNGSLDKRKKIYSELERSNYVAVCEFKKLDDNDLPGWIEQQLKVKGIAIDSISSELIASFTGNDLSRIAGEVEKLIITMPEGQNRITPELIEHNIGISKEYNDFELLNAVVRKDVLKSNRIALHFYKNPRNYPLTKTIAVFAYFFMNLMYYHYLADKTPSKASQEMGAYGNRLHEYEIASRNYNAVKTMEIIRLLRTYDARSKGFEAKSLPDGENLRELLYRILH